MSDNYLVLDKVTKRFAALKAVGGDDGLSFSIRKGSFLGLVGPNGAGKSTTFNLISGVLKPTSGRILLEGVELTQTATASISGLGLGRTFQTPRVFGSLSVLENVLVGADNVGEGLRAALSGRWRKADAALAARAMELLERVGLAERAGHRVSDLSGGELRMLEVARQLIREPRVFLLDEPTAGVDPMLQKKLGSLLVELHKAGTTLIVVEHNLHFLFEIADTVVVLQSGQLLAEGTPDEIRSNKKVIAAYLGAEHAA